MPRSLTLLAAAMVAALAGTATAADSRIILRADTNRDGRIALTGTSDEVGKGAASVYRGALVLPNIDDDSGRCAPLGLTEARQACFDGADEVINGDDDLLDLVELRTVPAPRAPKGATATIAIEGTGVAYARLFVGQGMRADGYTLVTPSTVFTAAQLRQGLTFRLEAKTFARDLSVWDGTFTVALTAKRGKKSATDRVVLHVAPLLTHTHAHPVNRLLTAAAPRYKQGDAFLADLRKVAEPMGIPQSNLDPSLPYLDVWVQDYTEPMYASVPTATGSHGMAVLMRSEQVRDEQLNLFQFQGKDVAVGAITMTDRERIDGGTYDSFGDLETIPRHTGYPAGRQILGGAADGSEVTPTLLAFLAAQQAQAPLRLDTSWLIVGHVDEFISFLPANTPLGFRIAVADPDAATALIQAAVDGGLGDTKFSTSRFEPDTSTLSQLLARSDVRKGTAVAREHIEANLARVLAATGATMADVIRIPVLYKSFRWMEVQALLRANPNHPMLGAIKPAKRAAFIQSLSARESADDLPVVHALYPNGVNWLVLDGTTLAVANQHAPLLNGVDFMQAGIAKVLAPLGYTPNWIEDYSMYHLGDGEVHCGTNTMRTAPAAWWR